MSTRLEHIRNSSLKKKKRMSKPFVNSSRLSFLQTDTFEISESHGRIARRLEPYHAGGVFNLAVKALARCETVNIGNFDAELGRKAV